MYDSTNIFIKRAMPVLCSTKVAYLFYYNKQEVTVNGQNSAIILFL
jgi:hypothetical protein